jgi:hypothetical protein
LTASRRAANYVLYLARGSIGACILDANIIFAVALLMVVSIWLIYVSIRFIYVAGRIAERRGRSFKIWAWIAFIIGPLAFPLVFLFPNLHGKNGDPA